MNKKPSNQEKKSIRLARWIIKRKGIIEKLFMVACVLSVIGSAFVNVNYDLTKYIPGFAESRQGLDVMEQEFGYPGTARVMLEEVTLYQALEYKDKMSAVDGVDQILWCDTTIDILMGEDFIQQSEIKDYYKDGYAVMDITFEEGDTHPKTSQAIDHMKEITGSNGRFVGTAVQNKSLAENLASEMGTIQVIAVLMIFVILCISTTAWTEPILFLLVMAVALLLNKGTNIFLGDISFLTDNVVLVLQLATSMDYSIFLLHAFNRGKENGLPQDEALIYAIDESINSILSSSMTTVVGFVVLVFMQFSIGFDLGLSLAKGVVLSLLTVLFLMPALILRFEGLNNKTKHRLFLPQFKKFGHAIYKIRYLALVILVVITPPAYTAQGMNDFLFGNSAVGASEGTQVYIDDQAISEKFGRSNLLLALYPNTSSIKEKQLSEEIENLPYVKSITSVSNTLPDGMPVEFLPESTISLLHTEDYARMLIYTRTKDESEVAFQAADEIKEIVRRYYPEGSYLVGETPSTQDIKSTITKDYTLVNALSIIGIFVVVMLSFKSLVIPIIVLIPIQVATYLNMAVPYLISEPLVFMGYITVGSIQMGATVDYSILLTNNYLDCRKTLGKKDALIRTMELSMPSIFTSGTILILSGYIIYFISSVAAIGDIGHLIGRGALLSVILVVTVLPTLMFVFDRFITGDKIKLRGVPGQIKMRLIGFFNNIDKAVKKRKR